MMRFLRKHRTWLMTVIAVLSIPFIFYFVRSDYSAIRPDEFARVYGRTISLTEARRDARLFDLARVLGMTTFLQDLAGRAEGDPQGQVYGQFILNLQILRHEAARLGIRPAAADVIERVRNLEPFRSAAGFDMNKYNEFVENVLAPNGQTEAQLEEIVRDELALERIKQLVATGVTVSDAESKADFEKGYSKLFVSVVRLSAADFARDVKFTDDDIRKYYEAHKTELKSPEKRKVDFVSLVLSDEQKKLTGKERIDALQKLADRANDFTQALLEKGADFKQVAAKFQLPVETTGEFTAAATDPQLKADAKLGSAAFRLAAQEPISDPIQVADGFYVLHLAGIAEARPLSLEEANPQITEAIKSTRARELMMTKANEIAQQLRQALGSGQPLDAAAQKTGVKLEKLPEFSLVEDSAKPEQQQTESPDLIMIKNAVAELEPGGVSDVFPSETGATIAVLERREPPEEKKYSENKSAFEQRYLRNMRTIAFHEWLRGRQRDAGLLPAQKS
ncbi:MAG TPA: peptidyl-prolyl cis-trans isomerase [Chthoniobacterales bacterium]|nr:peptidyl-prolyl cis-trans isomerase [Chthoniobacterales bacterium]